MQAAGGAPLTAQDVNPLTRVRLLLGVAVFVIAADIVSKAIAVAHIREYSQIHLIGNLLMLTLTRNGGAAFNLGGTSMTIVFTAIAAGVVIYILRAARNLGSVGWAITLGLLLGGATGNLIDRVFRAPAPFRGDVVDWIELPHWPVFNVADSSIVCAGVLVVLLALRGTRLDGTRPSHGPDPPRPAPTGSDYPQPDTPDSDYPTPGTPAPPGSDYPSTPGSDYPSTPGSDYPSTPGSDYPSTPESDYPKPDYPEPQSSAAKSHDPA